HRIAGGDDDEDAEGDEEPAEVEEEVLEEGDGNRGGEEIPRRRQVRARYEDDGDAGDARDHRLDGEARAAGKSLVGLLRDLEIVVVEADGTEAERHEEHNP